MEKMWLRMTNSFLLTSDPADNELIRLTILV